MSYTTQFTTLLGECRRQMNGAVAGSMRFYGADYGLNYGVSLPTVRSLAEEQGQDHKYAKYLYLQEVREIRLASLHIAQADQINDEELDFWADGIINSEVAEEAAFALFQHVACVDKWLSSNNELLLYTAILSISKNKSLEVNDLNSLIINIIARNNVILTTSIITLFESYYRCEEYQKSLDDIVNNLPQSSVAEHIKDELEWRFDAYRK